MEPSICTVMKTVASQVDPVKSARHQHECRCSCAIPSTRDFPRTREAARDGEAAPATACCEYCRTSGTSPGGYIVGSRLVGIAAAVLPHAALYQAAKPSLWQLADTVGETAWLVRGPAVRPFWLTSTPSTPIGSSSRPTTPTRSRNRWPRPGPTVTGCPTARTILGSTASPHRSCPPSPRAAACPSRYPDPPIGGPATACAPHLLKICEELSILFSDAVPAVSGR
jgi:hypothetical protein